MRSHAQRLRGFTLIELILVLSVGSMITLLSFQGMKRTTESNQAAIVGQQMRIVGTAVNNYISTRYTPISQLANAAGTASDPGPRTCAGATCTITVQTLVNEGLLPGNYANRNSFASPYTIVLTVSGTTPNWQVNGLVTTATPWTVGGVTRYDLLGQAMVAAGPDSGMTRSLANRIDGYNGIWNEPSSTYSNITQLGQLGFRAGYGSSLYSAFLRRDGTLPMTGDLNMNDGTTAHNIAGATNITGTGRFSSAQNYTSYVNLAGNLDMTGTATVSGNANVGGNLSANGVYGNLVQSYGNLQVNGSSVTNGNATVGGGVYSNYLLSYGALQVNGSSATNGNATVSGGVYTNYLQSSGAGYIGNGLTVVNGQNVASGNLNLAQGSLTMPDGGQINNSGTGYFETAGNLYLKPWNGNGQTIVGGGGGSGQLVVTGRQYNNEFIQFQGLVPVGSGCGPNGLVGADPTGALASCVSGVWKKAGGLSQVIQRGVSGGPGNAGRNATAVAMCASNEVVLGGGTTCNSSDGLGFIINNQANGQGWLGVCGDPNGNMQSAVVVAVCGS